MCTTAPHTGMSTETEPLQDFSNDGEEFEEGDIDGLWLVEDDLLTDIEWHCSLSIQTLKESERAVIVNDHP